MHRITPYIRAQRWPALAAAALFLLLASCSTPPAPSKERKVYIDRQDARYVLFRDKKPFTIKGAAGFSNFEALHAAGGNTIRTWDTAGLGDVLDRAHAAGIAVIAGIPIPLSRSLGFYKDTARVTALYNACHALVNRYKDHPALLMWCLGNEVDFPYRPRFRPFYKTYNRLLEIIHSQDPEHPVTTALINFDRRCIYNIRWKVKGLDLISLNIFGELPNLERDLKNFSWFWNGPFLISEWGINGPWETETTAWGAPIENTSNKKAEQYLQRYTDHMPVNNPRFLGACIFYWGQKQEVTHTWFSLFSENGAASPVVQTMQQIWTGQPPTHKAPPLKYMLVEGKGARDNILLGPGTVNAAEILFDTALGDSLRVTWEIVPEDWYTRYRGDVNARKPVVLDSLLLSLKGNKTSFRAPAKEGPYRIFATVSDAYGNFVSANTPFYVVAP